MKRKASAVLVLWAALLANALASTALGQATQDDSSTTVTGTVVSASSNTIVVRTEQDTYQLFIFDSQTFKPRTIPTGSTVRVISVPTSDGRARLATDVAVRSTPASTPSATAPAQAKPAETPENVPVAIRQLERDIERGAKKYGAGVRAGVGLDPEILILGVHARFGPIANRSISFRPNAEFGWGEVTKQITINLDGAYRLPFSPRLGNWNAYVGGGPALGFGHRNFEEAAAGDSGIDFGEFDFKAGLNLLVGVEMRSGLLFEMRTTIYADPHLRLIVGYTF